MADLAAPMSMMKRKDVEVVVNRHGFSIFLDPKRIKLQDGMILDKMEEDEPLAIPPTATAPTIVYGQVDTVSGAKSSESPFMFRRDEDIAVAAPMDVEADARQHQSCQHDPFFSGFF